MPNSSSSLLLGLEGIVVETVTLNDEHSPDRSCPHCRRVDRSMSAVRHSIVAVAGLGDDPAARYQGRSGPATDRVAEAEVVVYQHVL